MSGRGCGRASLAAVAAIASVAAVAPAWAEIQPRTYVFVGTIGGDVPTPRTVSVAVDGVDRVLAVWTTTELGTLDVYGRTYDTLGNPASPVFRVNPFTDGDEQDPRAAGLPGGGFVVVWDDEPTRVGSSPGIQGIFVAADGTAGAQFAVATSASDLLQEHPALATAPDGTFVVAWQADPDGLSGYDVRARRFDGAGNALTDTIPVNDTTAGDQIRPAVDSGRSDGSFVVAWETSAGAPAAVSARRFAANGDALAAQFPPSDSVGDGSGTVSVATDADGGETFLWKDPTLATLRVRHFAADGTAVDLAGPIPTGTDTLWPCSPGLLAAAPDRFAVFYETHVDSGFGSSHVAELSSSGPATVPFDIAATTGGRCDLAGNPRSGRVVAVYAVGTFLQFEIFAAGLPFADSFENGSLAGWSEGGT